MLYFANNHTIFVKKTSTFPAKENKSRKIDYTSLEFQPNIMIIIGHHCEKSVLL